MSDQDVFNEPAPVVPTADATPAAPVTPDVAPVVTAPVDAFADQLSVIKNADGTPKFTGVAEALGSIPHAQTHISTIEAENATLKENLATATAAKELLAKQLGEKPAPAVGMTPEQVAHITRQTMDDAALATSEAANVASVNAKFSELYGAKAIDQMNDIAKQAGMSVAAVKELAKTSPQAVFRLAGINVTAPAPVVPKTPGQGSGDTFTTPSAPAAPKSIMGGSNTADLVANWRAAGEIVKQNP